MSTKTLGIIEKDPDESMTFTMDWTARLGSDTIATSTWTLPAGLTRVTDGIVTGNLKTSIKLSGGVAGQDYIVTNTITTTTSTETWQRSGTVAVRAL